MKPLRAAGRALGIAAALALVALCFAAYLRPDALLSVATALSFCG
ncbi:hypothetical protein [Burkholderia sp. FERM BP-3421]|jgi:hypothetical protein|nr:hypothetical protein [Burkholderia sp. FERM BP-3421]